MRRLVAFWFHAPGLWIFYGERPPMLRANAAAVALTLAAMLLAWSHAGARGALIAWAVGHVLWGAYLALKI